MVDNKKKKILAWALKAVFTILFVYIVNHSISYMELRNFAHYLQWKYIAAAIFFGFFSLFFQVKRWEIILKYQKFPVKNFIAWKTLLWGNLLAFVTPGRFGEIFRGIKITENRKGDSLFAVIIDKLFIIITIFLTALFCILFQVWVFKIPVPNKMKLFLICAPLGCIAGFLILTYGAVLKKNYKITKYLKRILKNLPDLFTPAGKKAFIYSVVAHACLMCQSVILLYMFGCDSIGKNFIAVGTAYGIILFMPFTIANMGVREGAFYFLLLQLEAECSNGLISMKAAALGASIIILIMNIVLPAFFGLVWYLFENTINKDIKDSA